MSKILVIGNQGYLGSRLTEYLVSNGYYCRGIDTGFFKDGQITKPNKIEMISRDVRDIGENELIGFNTVVHLAGISNDPFGHLSPEKIYDPTRDYALKIANICKKRGIKFIYPSSCSVYGAAVSDSLLDEEMPTNPQTYYSINKLQVENGLKRLADKSFSPIALRFGTIYGISSRIRFDVVINMLCGLAITSNKVVLNSNGEAWRPHLYIDDACEAIRRCIEWEINTGDLMILNVGQNEDNIKVIDIAKMIHSFVVGSELTYLTDSKGDNLIKDKKIQDGVDTRTYRVSFDKINKVLPGFRCQWTVKKGIKKLLLDLERVQLTSELFSRRDFYRLQQLEFLHNKKMIDDDLFWIK